MKVILTPAFVRSATCPATVRKQDYYDLKHRGLLLEVRRSGGKTFYQRYRDFRGRERQFKLGPAHILSLSAARAQGRRVVAEALIGEDPRDKRRELRAIPRFADFVQEQYLPYAKTSKRSWRTDETLFRLHITPSFGQCYLDQLSCADVAGLLHRMREAGYASGTTNRVLILLRFAYNLAKKWNVPGARSTDPTEGLTTQPDVCRERYLTLHEAQRLLSELDKDENQIAAQAIKLLLLTGARRNEITHCEWNNIDWERKIIRVPLAKSGRSREIALNGKAFELLCSLERTEDCPYVFPSPITGRPCASLFFPWSRIRKRAGLQDLRLHDLRHSFASFLVNRGVSLYVVQHLLGHTQPRMTQRYAHLATTTLVDAADIVSEMLAPDC